MKPRTCRTCGGGSHIRHSNQLCETCCAALSDPTPAEIHAMEEVIRAERLAKGVPANTEKMLSRTRDYIPKVYRSSVRLSACDFLD